MVRLEGFNEPWYCLSCTAMFFPFGNMNNQKFLGFISDNNNESKIFKQFSDSETTPRLSVSF